MKRKTIARFRVEPSPIPGATRQLVVTCPRCGRHGVVRPDGHDTLAVDWGTQRETGLRQADFEGRECGCEKRGRRR